MFCLLISGTKEIPSFIFWKLYVHMHVNKTKFERNSSLEYLKRDLKWVYKTYELNRSIINRIAQNSLG